MREIYLIVIKNILIFLVKLVGKLLFFKIIESDCYLLWISSLEAYVIARYIFQLKEMLLLP